MCDNFWNPIIAKLMITDKTVKKIVKNCFE